MSMGDRSGHERVSAKVRRVRGLRIPPSSREARPSSGIIVIAGLLGLLWACDDSSSEDVLTIEATGTVSVQLLFDANGSGGGSQDDPPLEGWSVRLDQAAGGTLAAGVTDVEGRAEFLEVPVGHMVPAIGEAELGDSLAPVPSTIQPFTLVPDQTVNVLVLATLPIVSVPEARALPAGVPVFVEGVALNRLPSGDDRSLHLMGSDSHIRIVSVDTGAVFPTDSVRVRGRTVVAEGQPALDGAAAYRMGPQGQEPEPDTLTTAEAAGAKGGTLDAALVAVSEAGILQVTEDGAGGARVFVDDGSGPLILDLRSFLGIDPGLIGPDTHRLVRAVGLLVPVQTEGTVRWVLQPRSRQEVTFQRIGE